MGADLARSRRRAARSPAAHPSKQESRGASDRHRTPTFRGGLTCPAPGFHCARAPIAATSAPPTAATGSSWPSSLLRTCMSPRRELVVVGRRSTWRSCWTGPAPCPATRSPSPSRQSSSQSADSRLAIDSPWWSTTTSIDVVVRSTEATSESRRDAIQRDQPDRRAQPDEPRRGLAARLRAGGHAPGQRGRQSRAAADRRPGQRRHHRSRRAGPARRRASCPRRADDDLWRGRRLRRGTAPGHGDCRRRQLLLHRRRAVRSPTT